MGVLRDKIGLKKDTVKLFNHEKEWEIEAGGITLWIDELYVLKGYRSKGLGKEFFNFLKTTLDTSIVRLRLEVDSDNERAIKLYENIGFKRLKYDQMFKDRKN